MSRIVKRIGKIIDNPKNVSFDELESILNYFGWVKRGKTSGSHFVFEKEEEFPITIPKNKPFVKKHYVANVIEILELEGWYENNR